MTRRIWLIGLSVGVIALLVIVGQHARRSYLQFWRSRNCWSDVRDGSRVDSASKEFSAWITDDACEWGGSWHSVLFARKKDVPIEVFQGDMVPQIRWTADQTLNIQVLDIGVISKSLHQAGPVAVAYSVDPSIALPQLTQKIARERNFDKTPGNADPYQRDIAKLDLRVAEQFMSWINGNIR